MTVLILLCVFLSLEEIDQLYMLKRCFHGFWSFTYNLRCWKNISLKSATLNQQINISQEIVIDLWVSSPGCIKKPRTWEDERSVCFKLVFLMLGYDFDIKDCIFISRKCIVSVVWCIMDGQGIIPFLAKKKRKRLLED